MCIYDFDKTIYSGDSSIDFFWFCFRAYPLAIIRIIPIFFFNCILYKLKKITKEKLKSEFFSFLKYINNTHDLIDKFWLNNYRKLKKWYLEKKHNQDIIISASPEFLLCYPCNKLGVKKLIATKVDIKTGELIGLNCYGKEKTKRLKEEFGEVDVCEAYSDSMSDIWIFKLAKFSYLVKKDRIIRISV